MYPISTKTQKKIAFIPLINISTLFFTLYNCICLRIPMKDWMKIYLFLLCSVVPSAVFWMVLAKMVPELSPICSILTMYITPLCMSFGLIRFQRKYLDV